MDLEKLKENIRRLDELLAECDLDFSLNIVRSSKPFVLRYRGRMWEASDNMHDIFKFLEGYIVRQRLEKEQHPSRIS